MIIKLFQELIKAAKEDRDARVKTGDYAITLHLKEKKLEAEPGVKEYMAILHKKMNTPEVLDVISELTAKYMAYGSISDKEIKDELEKVL